MHTHAIEVIGPAMTTITMPVVQCPCGSDKHLGSGAHTCVTGLVPGHGPARCHRSYRQLHIPQQQPVHAGTCRHLQELCLHHVADVVDVLLLTAGPSWARQLWHVCMQTGSGTHEKHSMEDEAERSFEALPMEVLGLVARKLGSSKRPGTERLACVSRSCKYGLSTRLRTSSARRA
jgi:hypothetical protein